MSGIDWSKAPDGTTGAMVANFKGATVTYGSVEFIGHPKAFAREVYQEDADSWVYHERPVPWSGEGLPPVGAVCLLRYDNGGWGEALIKYISETMCVWQWVRPEHEQQNVEWGQSPQHIEFQRIRTQEELLAEAREDFIDELVRVTCIRRAEAGLIYDAGYRKVQP